MFTDISWGNYIIVVVLLLVSWYLFVGLRFYFDELKAIATGKRKFQFRRLGEPDYGDFESKLNDKDLPKITSNPTFREFDPTLEYIETLKDRLKNLIADAGKKKLHKQEFLDALELILKAHLSLMDFSDRSAVTEFIVSECQRLDAINLTHKEVERLWDEKI
jgi:hypothetical protein